MSERASRAHTGHARCSALVDCVDASPLERGSPSIAPPPPAPLLRMPCRFAVIQWLRVAVKTSEAGVCQEWTAGGHEQATDGTSPARVWYIRRIQLACGAGANSLKRFGSSAGGFGSLAVVIPSPASTPSTLAVVIPSLVGTMLQAKFGHGRNRSRHGPLPWTEIQVEPVTLANG